MARIALGIVGAIAGALIPGVGWALGFTIGSVLGSALFPPKIPTQFGPRMFDRQVSSSANGSPIPWGYGTFRVGGEVIWAQKIKELKHTERRSAKGGPTVTTVTYTYSITMAVAFAEGPADITRIWADSKLVFDKTGTGPQSIGTGMTSTGVLSKHAPGHVVTAPTFYRGTATQLPDPTIQSFEGVGRTPAFRDLCYMVVVDFPLADFGNRIPNIRAEVTVATNVFPRGIFSRWGLLTFTSVFPNGTFNSVESNPHLAYVDPFSRVGFCFDSRGQVGRRINLDDKTTTTPPAWQASTAYLPGDLIKDSNGNIQMVNAITGNGQSGTVQPTWATGEGLNTLGDNNVTQWKNLGSGPTSPAFAFTGRLTEFTGTPNSYFNMIRETAPGAFGDAMGVSSRGFIWAQGWSGANGGGVPTLFKYDPISFRPLGSLAVPGGFFAPNIAFARYRDRDLVYLFQATNVGREVIVYDGDSFLEYARARFAPSIASGSIADALQPGVDPATGTIYVIGFSDSVNPNNWYITVIDPRGFGGATAVTTTFATSVSTYGNGTCALYNQADHSLLIFTGFNSLGDFGNKRIIKVDIATMTITAQTANDAWKLSGADARVIARAYQGVVPIDGILRVPNFDAGTSTWFIDYYDARTLVRTQRVAISGWFKAAGADASITSLAYDEVTNSFLCAMNGTTSTYHGTFIRIWLDRQGVGGSLLSEVVSDLIKRTGIDPAQVDASALSTVTVQGYSINRTSDVKATLLPLAQAFFFDIVESDFRLKAVPRGGSPKMIIPEDDLGTQTEKLKVHETLAQQHDISKQVTVIYYDPALDLQQGKQLKSRSSRVIGTKNQIIIELPLNLTSNEARTIAERALAILWAERNQYGFKLWNAKYLQLDPADVVQFTYQGLPFQTRLVKSSIGQNRLFDVTGVSEDPRNYIAVLPGAATEGFRPGTIPALGPTLLFLVESPLLLDQDSMSTGITGFYFLMSSPTQGWSGGVLFYSSDDQNYIQSAFDGDIATYGYVAAATPEPLNSPYSWDFVTRISVRLAQGTLSSTSLLNVLNGANAAYLNGEIIQFANAVLESDGSYTLSTLLRGRRGTEGFVGGHATGETFILLTLAATKRQQTDIGAVGTTRFYKGVTLGNPLSSAAPQTQVSQGKDLKPYAPTSVKGTWDTPAANDITISWIRRTRVGGPWLDLTGTVSLSEESELYDVEILDDLNAVKRTFSSLATLTVVYTAAQQTTDFGAVQMLVKVRVYQRSAQVGRGFTSITVISKSTLPSGNPFDDFNRADGGLGANWTTQVGANGPLIVSNAVRVGALNQGYVAVYTAAIFSPNQFSQVKIVALATSAAFIVVNVRSSAAVKTSYRFVIPGPIATAVSATIYKMVNGVFTVLATFPVTPQVGDIARLEVFGSTLTAKINGATVGTASDNSIPLGKAGFELFLSSGPLTDVILDDFFSGNL